MNQNETKWEPVKEREIDFCALLWKALYSWRMMLILAVVFAVALSGLQYMREKRAGANAQKTELSIEEIKESLTEEELIQVRNAEGIMRQINEQAKYNENALSMQINPYEEDVVTLEYYVDTGYVMNYTEDVTQDYTAVLVNSYLSHINSQDYSAGQGAYPGELVSAVLNGDRQFTVAAAGVDEAQAEKLADQVEALIGDYSAVLAEKVGSHQIIQVNRYSHVIRDENLADRQLKNEKAIITMQTDLKTLTEGFSAAQNRVLAGEEEEEEEETAAGEAAAPSFRIKYFILGAIVGIFIGCAYVALCYLFSSRIKDVSELSDIYGVRIFGVISEERDRRAFSFVDRWLDGLRRKRQRTIEQQYELVLTNLKVTCKKAQIERVFFTTSIAPGDTDVKILNRMRQELSKEGIKSSFGEDIAHNAASLEQMAETEHVVLLEKAGTTAYADVLCELTLCAQQNADVLGVIGVE